MDSPPNVIKLFSDMLGAVNPSDRAACEKAVEDEVIVVEDEVIVVEDEVIVVEDEVIVVEDEVIVLEDEVIVVEDEVIVDLVNRCRSYQEKLKQILPTTGDEEELLCQGPELNNSLLRLLAKYDAIASGSPDRHSPPLENLEPTGLSTPTESSAPVPVIGPQHCASSLVKLEISSEVQRTSNFVVRDVNGSVIIFKVKEKEHTMHSRRVLVDGAGNSIVTIRKKTVSVHGRWKVFKGESNEKSNRIFTVRRSETFGKKTKLCVFLAKNREEDVCDFRIEESQSEDLLVVYTGESSTILAEMRNKAATRRASPSEDITTVKIYPNVDRAFIVTLIVIHECIKEKAIQRRLFLKKWLRRGRRGVAVIEALQAATGILGVGN